ncbi:uncharacterized protein LOC130589640 [Beta vulgaris subsp. vulgaris]|uniref:uncharacterized protein LOC130589640 n=1 Tax=Beta vulgaris subsp. vulgaris TaxID=3555 RepID=UPI00254992AA|nr:uncharacterized protein LOC130589640 [Beta vulgaris subsp. vulgaris]
MWQLFWLAAGATSKFTFKKAMQQIEKANPAARIWLANLGEQKRWTKHQFDTSIKSDVNKTNFVESFNSTLGIDRCRPVLTLLEGIKRVTMVRMATRREICEKWERSDICPNIVERVQALCLESRACRAYLSSQGEYEIVDGKSTLPVSLNNHTCVCNAWQLNGIPCRHGMRAILMAGLDPHKFVHEWYSVKRYKMAYAHGIKSIPDKDQWPETNLPTIHPPVLRRGVGRPVRNRRRGEEEQRKGKRSTSMRCGNCGDFGHNKLTCQESSNKEAEEIEGSCCCKYKCCWAD